MDFPAAFDEGCGDPPVAERHVSTRIKIGDDSVQTLALQFTQGVPNPILSLETKSDHDAGTLAPGKPGHDIRRLPQVDLFGLRPVDLVPVRRLRCEIANRGGHNQGVMPREQPLASLLHLAGARDWNKSDAARGPERRGPADEGYLIFFRSRRFGEGIPHLPG